MEVHVDYIQDEAKGLLELCELWGQWMVCGFCMYCGLMAAHGRCFAPKERSNAICQPIKKYAKDIVKLKREAQK